LSDKGNCEVCVVFSCNNEDCIPMELICLRNLRKHGKHNLKYCICPQCKAPLTVYEEAILTMKKESLCDWLPQTKVEV